MYFMKGCRNVNKKAIHKYETISIIIAVIIVGTALVYVVSELINRPTPIQTEKGIQKQEIAKIIEHPTATTEINPLPSDPWEAFLAKITTIDDVKKNLSLSYGRLNGAIKYENAEKWKDDDWEEQFSANYFQPSMYEKFTEVIDDKNLKSDLRNIAKLIAYVRETRDITTLKYAYEIVQDIVIYVMPTGAEDLKKTTMFGASFALDEHSEAIRIDKWIKANIK
jgi:hypothetical protein